MATTKPSSKTAAKKAPAKKTAAKKTSSARTSASSAANNAASAASNAAANMASQGSKMFNDAMGKMKDFAGTVGTGKFQETGKVLLDSRKKDLEALREAGKKSYEGFQSVMKRHAAQMTETMKEWQDLGKSMNLKEPQQNFKSMSELGRKSFQNALDSMRELSKEAAASQAEAFKVIQNRIKEDVAELSQLVKKNK